MTAGQSWHRKTPVAERANVLNRNDNAQIIFYFHNSQVVPGKYLAMNETKKPDLGDSPYLGTPHPGLSSNNLWAVFLVGIVLIVGLLYAALNGMLPPNLVEPVVRVALAAAAAGFAAFLPGMFQLKIPNSITAGGTLGIFVLVLVWNPGKSLVDVGVLTRCQDSVQARQYDIALERCAKAATEIKDNFMPMHLLGLAQYQSGQFAQAISSFQKAQKLPGADQAMILYNLAFAQSENNDLEGALKTLDTLIRSASGATPMLARAWFAKATIHQDLWLANPADNQSFENAEKSYKAFLEIGTPTYRAHANLACLYAIRATNLNQLELRTRFHRDAVSNFELAISDLRRFNRPASKATEVAEFLKEFGADSKSKCAAALMAAWQNERQQSYKEVLTSL